MVVHRNIARGSQLRYRMAAGSENGTTHVLDGYKYYFSVLPEDDMFLQNDNKRLVWYTGSSMFFSKSSHVLSGGVPPE